MNRLNAFNKLGINQQALYRLTGVAILILSGLLATFSLFVRWSQPATDSGALLVPSVRNLFFIFILFGLVFYLTLTTYLSFIIKDQVKNQFKQNKMMMEGLEDYAIFMLSPDGKIKSWNKSAQKILGYLKKDIIDQSFSIFFTPEDMTNNWPNKILKTAQQGNQCESSYLLVRKDGRRFWCNLIVKKLTNSHHNLTGYYIIIHDLTERRTLEQELKKLSRLIEESSDFVGISDLNGNLQYHNRSAKVMVGLAPDYDLSQKKISDMHPEWAAKLVLEKAIPEVLEKGYWIGESALLHQVSGKEIPTLQAIFLHRDAMGVPASLTTIIRNITKNKAQEEAIRVNEEIFRAAMQYASIGMALVSPEGKWLKVNKAFSDMLGYKSRELLKLDFQSITHPDDLNADLNYVQKLLSKEIRSCQFEKRYFHKDGHIIWVALSVSMAWNTNGSPKYFIAQIQNITDRKNSEKAYEKLMLALAESNTELGRFAYVASHDLQEPVRMINTFGKILLNEKEHLLDTEGKEYLKIVTDAGERMHDLINDLLAYSRINNEPNQFVLFDGETIFNDTLENIKTLIDEHNALIIHDTFPQLYGNPIQITRLLQNLLTNAIKYQPEHQRPTIQISMEEQDKYWKISMKDNGLGIEEQFIQEIFEPFRRLHTWEHIKGTGLGLPICKKIVARHGGQLNVSSIPGNGSVFYFTLPKH